MLQKYKRVLSITPLIIASLVIGYGNFKKGQLIKSQDITIGLLVHNSALKDTLIRQYEVKDSMNIQQLIRVNVRYMQLENVTTRCVDLLKKVSKQRDDCINSYRIR